MIGALLDRIPEGAVVTLHSAPIIYFLQDNTEFAAVIAPDLKQPTVGVSAS